MLIIFVVFALAVLSQRLFELRLAKKNALTIQEQGGQEFGAAHYPFIVMIHVLWYISLLVEVLSIGPQLNALWPLWLTLLVAAEALRYWVMGTLGPFWSMRIYAIPGKAWIRRGPYRYLAHPNYLVVLIELFVIPMIFNAWRTASVFSCLYLIALSTLRIPAEKKAAQLSS